MRANERAFPHEHMAGESRCGLTIREHFAALAMQGLLSTYAHNQVIIFRDVAHQAVRQADALVAALVEVQS